MDSLVQVKVLDHGRRGHRDLGFHVQGLTQHLMFDTYYFGLAMERSNALNDVSEALAHYLSSWVSEIGGMEDGGRRFFPIDVSDQYSGCLSVQRNGEEVELHYGHSTSVQGWSIDLNKPQGYFSSIADFRTDTSEPVTVDRGSLIASLVLQIDELKGRGSPSRLPTDQHVQ